MKNKLLCLFLFVIIFAIPAFAEKIPVKIAPSEVISTEHDEVEVGDWIEFAIVKDIYLGNEVYLPKDTTILGLVDFVHPNGWGGDCAEIKFSTFKTIDVNNEKITINYPLKISGTGSTSNDIKQYCSVLLKLLRGSEIFIEPDTKAFNIFITQ